MKKLLILFTLAALVFSSCNKGDGVVLTRAIVTVCGEGSAKPTLNLNDNTVLIPTNLDRNPYAAECRALTIYQDKGQTEPNESGSKKQYRSVKLYRIDSVLTKALAPNLGADNDPVYGTDPIDLYRSWLTVCEDGYITLHFLARWGFPGTIHTINLVKGTDSEDPYHLELRHNANGDNVVSGYRYAQGIAAFNIKELLTQPAGTTYDFSISYKGHYATKTVYFHYTPGERAVLTGDALDENGDNSEDGAMTNNNNFK